MNISLTQKPSSAPAQIVTAPVRLDALNWLLRDSELTGFATVKAQFGKA